MSAVGYDTYSSIDFYKAANELDITTDLLQFIIEGSTIIHPFIAYKLAKIQGTDIRFWMDLQDRYDSYKGEDK